MKSVNIAILGLSLRALNDLKQTIVSVSASYLHVNWVNISAPDLDILMVNDNFYDAPSIQNLIKNRKLIVLKLSNDAETHSQIKDNALYLPVQKTTMLEDWLSTVITELSEPSLLKTMIVQERVKEKIHPTQDEQSRLKILTELQNPRNGKIQVFDRKGVLALVDPRGEWVWCHPNRLWQNTDQSLNYTYATMNDSSTFSDLPCEDMKIWLWNILWQSPDFSDLSPKICSFLLEYWPQPKIKTDQRDILRMSACFAQGAKINEVADYLEIPEHRVRQFVAASLGANFGKIISEIDVHYKPNRSAPQADTGFMKKLFGGLRHRLGF